MALVDVGAEALHLEKLQRRETRVNEKQTRTRRTDSTSGVEVAVIHLAEVRRHENQIKQKNNLHFLLLNAGFYP